MHTTGLINVSRFAVYTLVCVFTEVRWPDRHEVWPSSQETHLIFDQAEAGQPHFVNKGPDSELKYARLSGI